MKNLIKSIICLLWLLSGIQGLIAQTNAVENFLAKANQKEQEGDKRQATHYLNEAASLEWEEKNYQNAIRYYEASIKLNRQLGNMNGIAMISNNIGMIYNDMEQYQKALPYLEETLKLRRTRKEKQSIVHSLINISVVLNNLNRYKKSAKYLEEALVLARSLNDAEQMRLCYGMLSETYVKAGNSRKAKQYFDLYRSFHELVQKKKEDVLKSQTEKATLEARLLAAEKRNQELELLAKERMIADNQKMIREKEDKITEYYETNQQLLENASKKELVINLLKRNAEIKEKDVQLKESKIKEYEAEEEARKLRTRIYTGFLITGLAVLAFVFTLIYLRFREKQRTNLQLSEQNQKISAQKTQILAQKTNIEKALKEITSQNQDIKASINYARRIQSALLDDSNKLQQYLPKSFIFFKPKDVVSGDFYWFAEVGDKVLLAAVDCTGHGVPGAFMSALGVSALRLIVSQGITSPDIILDMLNKEIVTALHQKESKVNDGMDIALVCIDKTRKELSFAGAHNPLVYIQNEKLHTIKGGKFSIGGFNSNLGIKKFQKHVVDLSVPTQIYIFSDGYQDQFGGERGRKFMAKRFRKLLNLIQVEPNQQQSTLLDKTLNTWMGDLKQIDDILIIGAKLDFTKKS